MAQTAETTVVSREVAIAASPETVWRFLVDSDKVARWWGVDIALDPRSGGSYRVEVIPGHTARGEYVELDPPRRLVLTWGWEADGDAPNPVPPGSTTVEIELVPSAAGTTLRLTHRDLPGAEATESHAKGWDHYLDRLAVAAAGGNPGRDPWLTQET